MIKITDTLNMVDIELILRMYFKHTHVQVNPQHQRPDHQQFALALMKERDFITEKHWNMALKLSTMSYTIMDSHKETLYPILDLHMLKRL
jgi:hypothetical protein